MQSIEKRGHERVQFFRLHKDHNYLPVWIFKPDGRHEAIAGVVLDMSASGIQILTDEDQSTGSGFFTLELLSTAVAPEKLPLFRCDVERKWSRPDEDSMYMRGGYAITGITRNLAASISQWNDENRPWLRCLLSPPVH